MALGILILWPGIEPALLALEVQNLNHWNTGEVPGGFFSLWCKISPQILERLVALPSRNLRPAAPLLPVPGQCDNQIQTSSSHPYWGGPGLPRPQSLQQELNVLKWAELSKWWGWPGPHFLTLGATLFPPYCSSENSGLALTFQLSRITPTCVYGCCFEEPEFLIWCLEGVTVVWYGNMDLGVITSELSAGK